MKRTRSSRSAPVAPAERSVRRRRKAGDDAAESHAPCAPALAHRDILRLIFAYFTRRTCLRSISLVNKRWRSLALESITSLDGLSSERALALLPGLTHLTVDVSYAVLPETAPTALTSLTLFVNPTWSGCRTHGGRVRDGDPRCRLEAFASLTALATLSLHFFYADAPLQDCALWLLSAHASRLTSLTVRLYTTPESFLSSPPKFRLTATLPALTAFDSNLLIISLRAFLAHHVPRLRTLRLDACTFQDLRSCFPATATDLGPLLTELGVGMSTRLDAFSLHDIPFKRLVRMNLIKREHGITQVLQTSMDSEAFERAVAMVTGALLPSGVKFAEWLPARCPLDPSTGGPVPCLLSPSTEELVFSLLHFSACTHAEVFIALLDYAITRLPRLRLVDMRRCVALPLLVSHQDRLFRVLRGAALHPTLERILLPRYMLTDELYAVVRKKIPHTQL